MEAHIYAINAPDGRRYIGSTVETIGRRFQRHLSRARVGERPHSRLYNAMRSVDLVGFTLELLRTVPIAERMNTEAHFIRTLKTTTVGLNTQIPGRTKTEWRRASKQGLQAGPPRPRTLRTSTGPAPSDLQLAPHPPDSTVRRAAPAPPQTMGPAEIHTPPAQLLLEAH